MADVAAQQVQKAAVPDEKPVVPDSAILPLTEPTAAAPAPAPAPAEDLKMEEKPAAPAPTPAVEPAKPSEAAAPAAPSAPAPEAGNMEISLPNGAVADPAPPQVEDAPKAPEPAKEAAHAPAPTATEPPAPVAAEEKTNGEAHKPDVDMTDAPPPAPPLPAAVPEPLSDDRLPKAPAVVPQVGEKRKAPEPDEQVVAPPKPTAAEPASAAAPAEPTTNGAAIAAAVPGDGAPVEKKPKLDVAEPAKPAEETKAAPPAEEKAAPTNGAVPAASERPGPAPTTTSAPAVSSDSITEVVDGRLKLKKTRSKREKKPPAAVGKTERRTRSQTVTDETH